MADCSCAWSAIPNLETGKPYEFLSNEVDLPAGVIVELYRRRWEAEKVFDELKNKLGQKKAWATSLVAKEAQAQLLSITHNLLLLYEHTLEREHGLSNQAEDQRRAKRFAGLAAQCAPAGRPLSTLVLRARRTTQRSVKFVRWVRQSIRDRTAEALAVLCLKALYAHLSNTLLDTDGWNDSSAISRSAASGGASPVLLLISPRRSRST